MIIGVLKRFLFAVLAVFCYCEYIIYYIVIFQCSWPVLDTRSRNNEFLNPNNNINALLLSDPHLLGSERGHWFDKLRREWQMKRSFQTAIKFLKPDVVFILGDIFDEGMICGDQVC